MLQDYTRDRNHLLAKFVSIARPERCMLLMLDLILDATVPTSVAATNCFLNKHSVLLDLMRNLESYFSSQRNAYICIYFREHNLRLMTYLIKSLLYNLLFCASFFSSSR